MVPFSSVFFCHFGKSQSLRDISNGLRSATGNLNHPGNVHPPTKSNLGYQDKHRRWELFGDYYFFFSNNRVSINNKVENFFKQYPEIKKAYKLILRIRQWLKPPNGKVTYQKNS